MSEAPERIWAWQTGVQPEHGHFGLWCTETDSEAPTQYRRADLPPTLAQALQVPEVAELFHAANRLAEMDERHNGDRTEPAMRNLKHALAAIKDAQDRGGK